ncbi:MAG: ATP-dependent DNA helicase RecG [Anaerolineae bacterium]|nr:ATP-dependent DNA helicase RecG [Anaerolineae bacterium]
MEESFIKFLKILKLESINGFHNDAILGGIGKYLPTWQSEASDDHIPTPLIDEVSRFLEGYASLTPSDRAEKAKSLFHELKNFSTSQTSEAKNTSPATKMDQRQVNKDPVQHHHTNKPHTTARTSGSNIGLEAPLTVLHGVGPQNAKRLEKLEIRTLGNLLHHYPRRYDDYSHLKTIDQLKVNDEVTVMGVVQNIQTRDIGKRRLKITEAVVTDNTGYLRVSWFNQPWIEKAVKPKNQIVMSGKIEQYLGKLTLNNPDWEPLDQEQLNTNRIVPVYPLTAGMTQKWMRKVIHQVLGYWADRISEYIPSQCREETSLLPIGEALTHIHFPESEDLLAQARKRLAFDEIFILQMGLILQKHRWQSQIANRYPVPSGWLDQRRLRIPFQLTAAQQRVIGEIQQDLSQPRPMNRLIQGDVGSGKTIVAMSAIEIVLHHQCQAAVMAPTSILAEQHYNSMRAFLTAEPDALIREEEIALLLGSTPLREKERIREALANGEIRLVVGTHALIEDPVQFQKLQLVVIDEQHRFGVLQRARLREKGENPHLLVMTATPIPRSMALTVYGDLDVSIMDEMPPGRKPVKTEVIIPQYRESIYEFIRTEIHHGRQAFVIYPLVEQGENDDAKAAVEEQQRLQKEVFPAFSVGLMHGRLKPADKDEVMEKFRSKQYDVLVSTSVVEVGVDVPNATIMVIEGANRFGLAQLHQFRGRVGRGSQQSYCFLLPDNDDSAENERLQVMAMTNDGFVLAEKDLEQRGPGDFLGTRQSGYSGLKIASLTDTHLIEMARQQAKNIHQKDPELDKLEHEHLKEIIHQWWNLEEGDQS